MKKSNLRVKATKGLSSCVVLTSLMFSSIASAGITYYTDEGLWNDAVASISLTTEEFDDNILNDDISYVSYVNGSHEIIDSALYGTTQDHGEIFDSVLRFKEDPINVFGGMFGPNLGDPSVLGIISVGVFDGVRYPLNFYSLSLIPTAHFFGFISDTPITSLIMYSGNASDTSFSILDITYSSSVVVPPATPSVPEPSTLALLSLAVVAFARRTLKLK